MSEIAVEETQEAAQKAKQLPIPRGYKLLCMVPHVEDTFSSGIVKAESTIDIEQHSTITLFVVKLGDMAYSDPVRFPTGPWCKEGDFVMVRAYSGTRFKIHGREFRIINDDTVDAVVEDPRGLTRA